MKKLLLLLSIIMALPICAAPVQDEQREQQKYVADLCIGALSTGLGILGLYGIVSNLIGKHALKSPLVQAFVDQEYIDNHNSYLNKYLIRSSIALALSTLGLAYSAKKIREKHNQEKEAANREFYE